MCSNQSRDRSVFQSSNTLFKYNLHMLEYFAIQKTLNDLFLLIAAVIMTSRSYFSRSSPLKDGSSTSNQSSVTLTNHATAISDKEIQQSKLLIFCYFLNYVTGYTGLISSSIHVYSLTFNSVKWISDNFLANVVVGISHMYLVFLGILIYFTERESAYLFKYFVRCVCDCVCETIFILFIYLLGYVFAGLFRILDW